MTQTYLVPRIGTGPMGLVPLQDVYRPKYVSGQGIAWSALPYGLEETYLIAAAVTPAQHDFLAAQADVVVLPALDTLVGGDLPTVQAALETRRMPADGITSASPYRAVLRRVAQLCLVLQRFSGRERRPLFEPGLTLETRFTALTPAQRTALTAAATSLGLDVTAITGPLPLRQALVILADQVPVPRLFGEAL